MRAKRRVIGILITDQVIATIGGKFIKEGCALWDHPVKDGHGQAEQRHGCRLDLRALAIPLRGNGIGKRRRRQQCRPAGR